MAPVPAAVARKAGDVVQTANLTPDWQYETGSNAEFSGGNSACATPVRQEVLCNSA